MGEFGEELAEAELVEEQIWMMASSEAVRDVNGPRGVYRSEALPFSVGISNGEMVRGVEVRFDGRIAHGYPGSP